MNDTIAGYLSCIDAGLACDVTIPEVTPPATSVDILDNLDCDVEYPRRKAKKRSALPPEHQKIVDDAVAHAMKGLKPATGKPATGEPRGGSIAADARAIDICGVLPGLGNITCL